MRRRRSWKRGSERRKSSSGALFSKVLKVTWSTEGWFNQCSTFSLSLRSPYWKATNKAVYKASEGAPLSCARRLASGISLLELRGLALRTGQTRFCISRGDLLLVAEQRWCVRQRRLLPLFGQGGRNSALDPVQSGELFVGTRRLGAHCRCCFQLFCRLIVFVQADEHDTAQVIDGQ